MISLTHLAAFVFAALVLLLTPGPAVMYIIARSADQGRLAGFVSVLGIEVGNFVHVIAAAAGLSAVLFSSAMAFTVVKYAGAAYLIYLGLRRIFERGTATQTRDMEPHSLRRIFMQGIVVAVLNPKTALFFLAFLPQFADPAAGSVPLQFLALGTLFVVMAIITDGGYSVLAGAAGKWLRNSGPVMRAERYVVGGVYVGLGLTAALGGARHK